MSNGGNGKKKDVTGKPVIALPFTGLSPADPEPEDRIKIFKHPGAEKQQESRREELTNALRIVLETMDKRGTEEFPINFDFQTMSMLYSIVSLGMIQAQKRGNDKLVKVAGQFRQIVTNLWLKFGIPPDVCKILNNSITILVTPDKKD